MADVFLSYKSEDRELVAALAQALEREGVSVWWDKKISAGGTWRETIAGALAQAKVVIVAWSKRTEDSADAAWVFNEVDEAQRMKLPIIPVQLEACNIPLGYRHVQAANLVDWRGDANNPEWHEVRDAVRAAIAGKPVGGATTARRAATPAPAAPAKSGGGGASLLIGIVVLAALAGIGVYFWTQIGPRPTQIASTETPAAMMAPPAPAAPAPVTDLDRRTFDNPNFTPPATRDIPIVIDAARVSRFTFGDAENPLGEFRHGQGDQWAEFNAAGENTYNFVRMQTQDNVMTMNDPTREVWLQFDFARRQVLYRQGLQGEFQTLYFIYTIDGRAV